MVEPRCPLFGRCGGCQTQHLTHEQQLANKQEAVRGHLARNGLDAPAIEVRSGRAYGYRNRMDFILTERGPGLRYAGRWERIICVHTCPIANDAINRILAELWRWFEAERERLDTFDVKRKRGTLRYCVVRAAEHGTISASFVLNPASHTLAEQLEPIKRFAAQTTADNVIIAHVAADKDLSVGEECYALKGEVVLRERIAGCTLRYHSQSFFQNNTAMAEAIITHAREVLVGGAIGGEAPDGPGRQQECEQESGHERLSAGAERTSQRAHTHALRTTDAELIDLYGGVGTFAIPLADAYAAVTLIESEPMSTACAEANATGVANLRVVTLDAAKLARHTPTREQLDLITDPPRSGMHPKALEALVRLRPRRILYISCNPAQMAREAAKLRRYYTLTRLTLFDLFPQTNHIEAAGLLERV